MRDVWDRLHEWLRENAPRGYGGLRRGASVAALREAEQRLGVTLPDDLRASLRVHDGQGRDPGLIGGEGWSLAPLEQIIERTQQWQTTHPNAGMRIAVAWLGTGDYVFANTDGALFVQRRDRQAPDPLSGSFREWLEGFAAQLENDEFSYSEEDGEIMYADEIE